MILREWHEFLDGHFKALHEKRRGQAERPVFALEHGLEGAQLTDLARAVREHIRQASPANKYWLPWVIYAAEVGYEYEGDEYWPPFVAKTPGWVEYGNREFIRDKFREFQRKYGGFKPSGIWAKHFNIICWPITHAILPKDLQRQLAKALYELRHAFTETLLQSPTRLGQRIAQNSWGTTRRFQQFAQDEVLIGQIAKALLAHEEEQKLGRTSLEPKTLLRIVKDLERERTARDWLRGARSSAQAVNLRGLSRGDSSHQLKIGDTGATKQDTKIAKLGIEPRVVLRPRSNEEWEAYLEIPDLAPLSTKFPKLREFLSNSRCKVLGTDRPIARGRLMNGGAQRITLKTWPDAGEVLLQFEGNRPADLDFLLKSECSLRPGTTWLCRIAADGLAYEVRTLAVRPSNKYILLSTAGPIPEGYPSSKINLTCEGVQGIRLDIPSAVSAECKQYLESQLGLSVARNVDVWPAGLCAKRWDGDGYAEWLSVETPCIGLCIDHPVESLLLEIDHIKEESLELKIADVGVPHYVQLSQLPSGPHQLRVLKRADGIDRFEPLGQLDFFIREPQPLALEPVKQKSLTLILNPHPPSLEQLRDGAHTLELLGPAGQTVVCSFSFFLSNAETPFLSKVMTSITLPVRPEAWKESFSRWTEDPELQSAFDAAHSCKIEINAGAGRSQEFNCERARAVPLTWSLVRAAPPYTLTILNLMQSDPLSEIVRYDFSAPDSPVPITIAEGKTDYEVGRDSGLYIARSCSSWCGIIVAREIRRQEDLKRSAPQLKKRARDLHSAAELYKLIELWACSTPCNTFAWWEQEYVLRFLQTQMFGLIGGWRWEQAEKHFFDHPFSTRNLSEAVASSRREEALEHLLLRHCKSFQSCEPRRHVTALSSMIENFVERVQTVRGVAQGIRVVRGLNWYTEFALRLAGGPYSLKDWAGQSWRGGLNYLLNNPVLARAARFVVLACDGDIRNVNNAGNAPTTRQWKWS